MTIAFITDEKDVQFPQYQYPDMPIPRIGELVFIESTTVVGEGSLPKWRKGEWRVKDIQYQIMNDGKYPTKMRMVNILLKPVR